MEPREINYEPMKLLF